ncbi:hypothetical protein M0R45_027818 [Rubus argutus]|uniref:Gamma-tubulin complex component n=1 Tax=Rubus argutus TaxID=59490 RepID=A0AAW1W3P6_RUBAR
MVLEPNWHVMHNRLQTTKSIDEVIQHHDFFLDQCLRGCLLLLPEFLKKVERLKSLCLQYASATQWLISSLLSEKPRQSKSRGPCQALTISSGITNFADAILKFEREFDAELQNLAPLLSSSSQADPYLTPLAQWILGIGNDQ